jgi:hypothetical protein
LAFSGFFVLFFVFVFFFFFVFAVRVRHSVAGAGDGWLRRARLTSSTWTARRAAAGLGGVRA